MEGIDEVMNHPFTHLIALKLICELICEFRLKEGIGYVFFSRDDNFAFMKEEELLPQIIDSSVTQLPVGSLLVALCSLLQGTMKKKILERQEEILEQLRENLLDWMQKRRCPRNPCATSRKFCSTECTRGAPTRFVCPHQRSISVAYV